MNVQEEIKKYIASLGVVADPGFKHRLDVLDLVNSF